MRTEDHKVLSVFLLNQQDVALDGILQHAFILGSIEPDYNAATHLHGSNRKEWFKGHNYKNADITIKKLIHKIEKPSLTQFKKFYLLGKLIHYIADIFTFPHNEEFEGSFKSHCIYETKLHIYIENKLEKESIEPNTQLLHEDLMVHIEKIHKEYIKTRKSYVSDYSYILTTVSNLFYYFATREAYVISKYQTII